MDIGCLRRHNNEGRVRHADANTNITEYHRNGRCLFQTQRAKRLNAAQPEGHGEAGEVDGRQGGGSGAVGRRQPRPRPPGGAPRPGRRRARSGRGGRHQPGGLHGCPLLAGTHVGPHAQPGVCTAFPVHPFLKAQANGLKNECNHE
eukprot:scaffold264703_cov50-Prasinocladus_malaysianus.AAC.1